MEEAARRCMALRRRCRQLHARAVTWCVRALIEGVAMRPYRRGASRLQRLFMLGSVAAFLVPYATASAQLAATSARPSLVAIQVEDLDRSIDWYTTHLGFAMRERKDFPDYHLKLA